jgi:hypothetical protein
MTLFAITNYRWVYVEWFVWYSLLGYRFRAGFDDGNPVYLISTKDA